VRASRSSLQHEIVQLFVRLICVGTWDGASERTLTLTALPHGGYGAGDVPEG
jgi:hypothetical protein